MGKRKTNKTVQDEWYTPHWLIDQIREEFFGGQIDLDPASCVVANKVIKAVRFYSKEDNSLNKPWLANTLFINPPYGSRGLLNKFTAKLVSEFQLGNIGEAVCLTKDGTDTNWFYNLLCGDGLMAFTLGRVSYLDAETLQLEESPSSGHLLTYFGVRKKDFINFIDCLDIPKGSGYPRKFIFPNLTRESTSTISQLSA